jgi:hypothetical protein
MRVLCTHAGRHGDALWALPTVRAIAETIGTPVDFCLSSQYRSLAPLISDQVYIGRAFADPAWDVVESAPVSPAEPPSPLARRVSPLEPSGPVLGDGYDRVVHLSFRSWPLSKTLAEGYWEAGKAAFPELRPLDLERPWIQPKARLIEQTIIAGFSDEWFELKAGLFYLLDVKLARQGWGLVAVCAPGSRWDREGVPLGRRVCDWRGMAHELAATPFFLGCLSAPWVLANAMGKRSVIVEPSEPRHHPVFWLDSPRNTLVRGADGKPTFDARAALDAVLREIAEGAAERIAREMGEAE